MKTPAERRLVELLRAKYQTDPRGFRSYLSEVAQFLETEHRNARAFKSPFGLTEGERAHRLGKLNELLAKSAQGSLSREEAMKALEHCATLIQDDNLPEDVGHDTLVSLLKTVLGKSPTSFKAIKEVPIANGESRQAINRVSLVRGVELLLDRDMRLVSVNVNPQKIRERRKLLGIVGVGRETATDVAARHDEYLAEQEPHAAP